ncbi:hypothetical protein KJ903_01285 [Patescibacteria group bacterium]|nr:hypothetical protein [Patescibacteria group bacterium]
MAKVNYQPYQPKTILNTQKHGDGGWFWGKYSASPYIGCQWGCVYCYCRDEKYNPHKKLPAEKAAQLDDPFSQYIKIKTNAPELLRKALAKKSKDLIYLDCYQPVDSKYRMGEKLLKVCYDLGFPVFINCKSPLLLEDLGLLKKIKRKSHLNIGWSIITARDDKTRSIFEPKAPPVATRFAAMKKLSQTGIITGTVFMPILPFIYDNAEDIENVVRSTKEAGGQYVLDGGLTLWGYCGTYFYKALAKYDSGLVSKYKELYNDNRCFHEYTKQVHELVLKYCRKYKVIPYIPRPVSFYPAKLRKNKEVAAHLYLEAREIQLSGQGGYREWAYRKGAWALDEMSTNIVEIYQQEGKDGIKKIKGIGDKLADKIVLILENKI